MADSTLLAIRNKIRRLTRSPSNDQLSNADIDEYVNTFIQYDFPEHLRLFSLKETFSFYTTPSVDRYATNTIDMDSPLFDFKDKFQTVKPPAYCAGYKLFFSQSRDEFFNIYPFISDIQRIGTGDGATTFFSGTVANAPILQNKLIFTSVDANNESLVLKDVPQINPVTGVTSVLGDLVVPDSSASVGTINYVTGVFSFNFPAAPASDEAVNAQSVATTPDRPQALLYFDNTFILRPVPDQAYEIQVEVFRRPTELLNAGESPELEQWWQYIAYGAAKKVFEDRMDTDGVNSILPEYKEQENLVLRRTIVQQTEERVSTIYTEQTTDSYYNGWGPGGGGF